MTPLEALTAILHNLAIGCEQHYPPNEESPTEVHERQAAHLMVEIRNDMRLDLIYKMLEKAHT